MAKYENLIYDKQKRIANITLNRPEKMNSLSVGLMNDLDAALKEAGRDDDVRVLIIKGAGRAFCTGYDLSPEARKKQLTLTLSQDRIGLASRIDAWMAIWDLPKPVIAQVHGFCMAGGTMLASICDLTIVAEDTIIGPPQVGPIGAGLLAPFWLPLIGPKKTKEYFFYPGSRMTGKDAERLGFANKAVPADKLEEEVNKIARSIAKVPLEILALEKVAINRSMDIQGFRNTLYLGAEYDAMARFTEPARAWVKKVAELGVKQAAAEWQKEKD
jgi:enoyl-CoA hydratase